MLVQVCLCQRVRYHRQFGSLEKPKWACIIGKISGRPARKTRVNIAVLILSPFNALGEKIILCSKVCCYYYPRLSSTNTNAILAAGTTYLDHAGTTPYPRSLLKAFEKDMNTHIFGNPHSNSPSSVHSTDSVESARLQALKFFKADPDYFDLIFVANATAAIKMVVDCLSDFRRNENGRTLQGYRYGYHADSHTSLVGAREISKTPARCFESDEAVEDWIHTQVSRSTFDPLNGEALELFAYPGQSNMNGRRLPLDWPGRLRSISGGHKVYSLFDAAAYVATSPLDLSNPETAPDFTALSFYKIFGFPDLGALIVRKEAGHVLAQRRYFGGGTVDMVINGSYEDMWHANKSMSIHEMLEDGTPAFHSITALNSAFRVHQALFGSMTNVAKHACTLVEKLYGMMSALSHANGLPVCKIYKDSRSQYGNSKTQGPTIAFNIRDCKGDWIGKSQFERLAILNNIQIRTGGVCNPGGIASALELPPKEMHANFREGVRCGNDLDEINGKPTGIIRVSLGAMSNVTDIDTFMHFLRSFVDRTFENTPLQPLNGSKSTDKSPLAESGGKSDFSTTAEGNEYHSPANAIGKRRTGFCLGLRSWRLHRKF